MYEHELQALIEQATSPPKRPCVACCIYTLTEFVLADRAMTMNCDEGVEIKQEQHSNSNNMKVEEESNNPFDSLNTIYGRNAPTKRVYQLFRNPVGVENGFFSEYTLNDPDATDVLVDTILRLNISTAFLVQDPVIGRVYLDIGMMRWKAKQPDQPKLGEKLSNF